MFQKQPFVDPLQSRFSWKIYKKAPVLESFLIKFRSRHSQMYFKITVLKKFSILSLSEYILTKLQFLRTATLLKGTQTQVFYCEFCELSKNTYFVDDLWMVGSEIPVHLFKNTFFTEHLQRLPLTVSGFQPAALLKRDSGKDVYLTISENF